ncbi:MAG: Gfo/Idh/MocA family protein [Thermoguttaceae bacterium]
MTQFNRRQFIGTTLAIGAAAAFPAPALIAKNANEKVRMGFVSCGGRSGELMGQFSQFPDVDIIALCDPDQARVEAASKKFPAAKTYSDMRQLFDNKDVDAVVVATANHWHCLASIWAMQAGKDVYVEKPLSHSEWEGKQAVNAARKYKRVCQVGTQQRSDPMQAEIKKFLHEEKALGKIISGRVNRYGVRGPIGKRETPLEIPSSVNYDLWLGPAEDKPLFRKSFHYDWHWDFNTGSGEMGNWGVHVMDDFKNNIILDKVALPKRICGGGARVVYNDAGDTPNIHFVYFDTGIVPVVIGLSNVPATPDSKSAGIHPGPASGYVAYCEGGRFEGQRGSAVAFDKAGKEIKKFRGNSGGNLHARNFLDAVRAEDSSMLNAEVELGNASTGWCNLANIAFRCGQNFARAGADVVKDTDGRWEELLTQTEELLAGNGLKITDPAFKLSPMLNFDAKQGAFVGDNADAANSYLKRTYRASYAVPEITG